MARTETVRTTRAENDQNGGSDNGSDTEQDPFSQIFPEYFRK